MNWSHNINKAVHNKTLCIWNGVYCVRPIKSLGATLFAALRPICTFNSSLPSGIIWWVSIWSGNEPLPEPMQAYSQSLNIHQWIMDNSYPRQLVPKSTRAQDNSYPRQLIPRITRAQDNSYPRRRVPKTTHTKTTRTKDNSYPRRLVP